MISNTRDEEFLELLRKALETRKKRAALPPKLEPELGKEYVFRLVAKAPSPWREGRHVFIVYDLETRAEYRLPSSVVLERELAGAKVGDYILVKLIESRELPNGRRMRNFEVAILPSEEAARLQTYLSREGEVPASKREARGEAKISSAPSPPPAAEVPAQLDEVKMLIETLLEVYGTVSIEDLDLYLNAHKKLNVNVEEVVKSLGYVVENGRVRKP